MEYKFPKLPLAKQSLWKGLLFLTFKMIKFIEKANILTFNSITSDPVLWDKTVNYKLFLDKNPSSS
jgi:hypothetical protein